MKTCPVCNDSFADELNFCDIDGTRLTREGSEQNRNKWWSLLGAALVVGALVISAASILFLPKGRVSAPLVVGEPQSIPVPPKTPSVDGAASITTPGNSESERASTEAVTSDSKKKEKAVPNANGADAAPDPKAAALAAEGVEKSSPSADVDKNAPKKTDTPPAVKSTGEPRAADAATKPAQPATEVKKDQKAQPATAKSSERVSSDKKKSNDKDAKKGGFLRVFKKIFGKD